MSFLTSLISPVVSLASSLIGGSSAKSAAAAQASAAANLNAETRQFNHDEAQLAREFSAQERYIEQIHNANEAQKARDFSAQQADLAYQRTLDMSNTAHQREVSDLRAAGLNPILSANLNGSSTLSAPMASSAQSSASAAGSNQASFGGGALAQQAQVGVVPSMLQSAASLINAKTAAKKAESDIAVNRQSIEKSISDVKVNSEMIQKIKAETGNINKQASLIDNQILESIGKQNLNKEEIKAVKAGVRNQTIIANAQAALNHWQGVAAQASASHSLSAAKEAEERIKTYKGQIEHAKQEAKAYEGTSGTAWYYFNAAASKVASLLK